MKRVLFALFGALLSTIAVADGLIGSGFATGNAVSPSSGAKRNIAIVIASQAASGGGTIQLPAGTFDIAADSTTAFTISAGKISLRGAGMDATTLRFVVNDADAYRIAFDIAADVIDVTDMTIEVVRGPSLPPGSVFTFAVFRHYASKLTLRRVRIVGGMVQTPANTAFSYVNHVVYPVQFASAVNASELSVVDCEGDGFSYTPLKNNADSSAQTDVLFQGNIFKNTFGGISVNSPKGSISRVRITGNTIDTSPWSLKAAAGQFLISVAGATNVQISDNILTGIANHAIHIEGDGADRMIITKNIVNIDGVSGILLLSNNISTAGGAYVPIKDLIITDNVVTKTGMQATGTGIAIGNVGHAPAVLTGIVSRNIVKNWYYGISSDNLPEDGVSIKDNYISDCGYGLHLDHGIPSVEGNAIVNCTTGVGVVAGGTLGKNTFQGNTTNWEAKGKNFQMSGFRVQVPKFAHAGGGTTVNKAISPASKTALAGTAAISVSTVTGGGVSDFATVQAQPTLTTAGIYTANNVSNGTISPGNAGAGLAYSKNQLQLQFFLAGSGRDMFGSVDFNGAVMVLH